MCIFVCSAGGKSNCVGPSKCSADEKTTSGDAAAERVKPACGGKSSQSSEAVCSKGNHGDGCSAAENCVRGNKSAMHSRPMSEVLDHAAAARQSNDGLLTDFDCLHNTSCSPMSESDVCHQQSRFGELALRKANPVMNLCHLQSGGGLSQTSPENKLSTGEDEFSMSTGDGCSASIQNREDQSCCGNDGCCKSPGSCCRCDVPTKPGDPFGDVDSGQRKELANGDGILKPFGQIRFPLSNVEFHCRRMPSECGTDAVHSGQSNSLLHDRRMSDYEFSRSLAASDLEVNMESEVDVQGLNASEEDVCDDRAARSRGARAGLYYSRRRGRDESSFDSSESETSESSIDHEQSPFHRLIPNNDGGQKSLGMCCSDVCIFQCLT
jgi:hypothetical protein